MQPCAYAAMIRGAVGVGCNNALLSRLPGSLEGSLVLRTPSTADSVAMLAIAATDWSLSSGNMERQ